MSKQDIRTDKENDVKHVKKVAPLREPMSSGMNTDGVEKSASSKSAEAAKRHPNVGSRCIPISGD
jgi:hypothetical protein